FAAIAKEGWCTASASIRDCSSRRSSALRSRNERPDRPHPEIDLRARYPLRGANELHVPEPTQHRARRNGRRQRYPGPSKPVVCLAPLAEALRNQFSQQRAPLGFFGRAECEPDATVVAAYVEIELNVAEGITEPANRFVGVDRSQHLGSRVGASDVAE